MKKVNFEIGDVKALSSSELLEEAQKIKVKGENLKGNKKIVCHLVVVEITT